MSNSNNSVFPRPRNTFNLLVSGHTAERLSDNGDKALNALTGLLDAVCHGPLDGRKLRIWTGLSEGTDACAAPVLSIDQAAAHPHNLARQVHGGDGPNPAPRLSRTPAALREGRRLGVDEALDLWARTGALLGGFNQQGDYHRKWALAGAALSFLAIRDAPGLDPLKRGRTARWLREG